MVVLKLIAGLFLLVIGAEALVKGASKIAVAIGISPLVIGLTIVAFGTSSPELAVSIGSAFEGKADIAVGNVFLGYYVAYTVFIILKSMDYAALEVFNNAMIWFVVPLTVLTLVVVTVRELRMKRR